MRARPRASASVKRWPAVPDIPTVAESGYPGFEAVAWFGLSAPGGTPNAIVQKLYQATTETLKSPTMIERLLKAGVAPIAPELRTPAYLKTFIATEVDNWASTIKASGVTIE